MSPFSQVEMSPSAILRHELQLIREETQQVSELLTMSTRELTRLEIMQRLRDKRLTQREAAKALNLSTRQIKRLWKAFQREGERSLISRRRSCPSNHRLDAALVTRAEELIRNLYHDFGPTLAHEKLTELHGLRLSVESVRQLMISAGLWHARRARRPTLHRIRERRCCLGELVQIDGSPHDWFEGRGARSTLLVFIDDATGRLMQLLFAQAETTFNYFAAVRAYITSHGKPVAFYSDKLGVFRVNQPCHTTGSTGLTQFGRAMKELDIALICANTPQAKGRVERANQTLQDRLVKELRLRGICSTDAANAYAPEFVAEFNRRFGVVPASTHDAHRPLQPAEDLDRILSLVEARTLSKNLTFSYNKTIYQVETTRPTYTMRGAHVEVREDSAGGVRVEYKGRRLDYTTLCAQSRHVKTVPTKLLNDALDEEALKAAAPRLVPPHPAPHHPWRKFEYGSNSPPDEYRRDTSKWRT